MRLFIAVNFNENIKNTLTDIIRKLGPYARQGSFTLTENLHLTLVFLGEVEPERVDKITMAMEEVAAKSFQLELSGLGHFRRDGGDIYWIGVENNETLQEIQSRLIRLLIRAGFKLEERKFKPHLTIGRRIIFDNSFNEKEFSKTLPEMSMEVNYISLMKSERINGRLTYTEIFSRQLDVSRGEDTGN
ncbi:MAG: RNA 2',3'-cyclic phosphodiesterase [Syntrophomonadaceae bacterium]|jgi:2'-5' RNA ligase